MNLDKIFKPKSITVIGASNEKGSVGFALFSNLKNYKGKVYPVNIKRKSVQGVKAYKNVNDIKEDIDLAIIATPAFTVPSVVEECGKKKISGAIIISAGFDEAGDNGKKLSQEIKNSAVKYKMRIIGPNCLGFISPPANLNASFAGLTALPGKIAFISQSGAMCTAVLDWSRENKVGFSGFVSIGSMLDIGFNDLIDYFGKDKNTEAIVVYMETLKNAKEFINAAGIMSAKKSIAVLKVGRSEEGSQAAKSHTGSMTGNDEVFDAAFKQAGIARIDSMDDMFAVMKLMNYKTGFRGKKISVITNAGGPGVIAADGISKFGLELARLSGDTISNLNKCLPATWSRRNPVDIIGDAEPERYKQSISAVINDKNIDALLLLLTPQAMTNAEEVAKEIVKIKSVKPILSCFMGGSLVEKGKNILKENNLPVFETPESALKSYAYLTSQRDIVGFTKEINIKSNYQKKKNEDIIKKVKSEKRKVLDEYEAKEFLKNYCIPVVKYFIANNLEEALRCAKKIGYPVVLKVLSSKIIHKTEAGTYVLDLKTPEELKLAYERIIKNAKKFDREVREVMVEKMEKKKYELIIGSKTDPIFGPVVIFGRGGTEVELYQDKSLRLAPIGENQALAMIKETKIFEILKGYRGEKGVDLKSLQKVLVDFSNLIQDFPEIKELDINPFVVDENGGVALDAKIILN